MKIRVIAYDPTQVDREKKYLNKAVRDLLVRCHPVVPTFAEAGFTHESWAKKGGSNQERLRASTHVKDAEGNTWAFGKSYGFEEAT